MPFQQARFNMIEQQIRPWDVIDSNVLTLLAEVKREDFVPAIYKSLAFADMEIPLGHNQHMLSPKVEARMLQDANIQSGDRVLEIGTGSGYMAALLAHQASQVLTFEIYPALVSLAKNNIAKADIQNIEIRQSDGAFGASEDGPFDVIILSGSVSEVPKDLMNQLSIGGRLVAITGSEPIMRATLITRATTNYFVTTHPWDTVATRLINFPEPSHFSF